MNLLLYGLQRSGTNFLEEVLRRHYRVRFLNDYEDRSSPLHKHFRLYREKHIIPESQYRNDLKIAGFADFERILGDTPNSYLIISKDPYSWLLSYCQWAKKCHWPEVSHHYIAEYNLFHGKWLEFSRQTNKIVFIRYVDLLQNAARELSLLEATIGLKKRFGRRVLSSRVNKVAQSPEFSNDRAAFYVNKLYLRSYTARDLREVNSLVDPDVLSGLRYHKEENVGETPQAIPDAAHIGTAERMVEVPPCRREDRSENPQLPR